MEKIPWEQWSGQEAVLSDSQAKYFAKLAVLNRWKEQALEHLPGDNHITWVTAQYRHRVTGAILRIVGVSHWAPKTENAYDYLEREVEGCDIVFEKFHSRRALQKRTADKFHELSHTVANNLYPKFMAAVAATYRESSILERQRSSAFGVRLLEDFLKGTSGIKLSDIPVENFDRLGIHPEAEFSVDHENKVPPVDDLEALKKLKKKGSIDLFFEMFGKTPETRFQGNPYWQKLQAARENHWVEDVKDVSNDTALVLGRNHVNINVHTQLQDADFQLEKIDFHIVDLGLAFCQAHSAQCE